MLRLVEQQPTALEPSFAETKRSQVIRSESPGVEARTERESDCAGVVKQEYENLQNGDFFRHTRGASHVLGAAGKTSQKHQERYLNALSSFQGPPYSADLLIGD